MEPSMELEPLVQLPSLSMKDDHATNISPQPKTALSATPLLPATHEELHCQSLIIKRYVCSCTELQLPYENKKGFSSPNCYRNLLEASLTPPKG
ncbi:Uncharacterized protein TCM_043007 [Theobroma cacao]|uniref:Uncharacterized protein n=1 Tax=Theobroma cacao TaxID=3641 RepID=A0A061FM56_THECC|nr:Uncharacterized protein TCM_043007 [Theobroma cacao]